MDPFTQRMLERARARQEKIDQKLASTGQSVTKRKPLTENITALRNESPVKSPVKSRIVSSPRKSVESFKEDNAMSVEPAQLMQENKPEKTGLRSNVKSRLDRLGNLYSDTPNLSSPIHRTEQEFTSATPPKHEVKKTKPEGKKFGRFAALADQINNWEDDLTHHNFHQEPVKKNMKMQMKHEKQESTLDVSIHSLADINKVLHEEKSKQPDSRAYSKPSANECQRLKSQIVAELEGDGFRRVSAGKSRLVYDFTATENADPTRQEPRRASTTPSDVPAPDMAAIVASTPPNPVTKKPSIKKYRAPTPPHKVPNADDKDKENNVHHDANDNAASDCIQTKPEPVEKPAVEKGSPLVKRLAPKLNGNVDRSSVLSKAAMFEAGSPRAKDPAEMSLRERKALFEKNKGAAIVPKAPFGMAPSVKTLHGENKADSKTNKTNSNVRTTPVKSNTSSSSNSTHSRDNIDEDSISQSSLGGGIRGKLAALFNKEQTISESSIANKFKQEREREMEMLQNRFQFKPKQEDIKKNNDSDDDQSDHEDPSEAAPLMGSNLNLASSNKKPEIISNVPKVAFEDKKSVPHDRETDKVVSQSVKRRSSQDSPVVLSVLDEVKRIKVNNNKKESQVNGVVTHQPTLYPHLSDIETDTSHTQEEYSDCGGSSSESEEKQKFIKKRNEDLNKSDNWAETSFGREIMSVVKKNNTSYKKAVRESSSDSDGACDSELDEMLDEALNEEGPTPPKLNKQSTSSSSSFVYQDQSKFKSPQKPPATPRADKGSELVHSVSFYRRMQSASSTPSTPLRVIRHTSPERETPNSDPAANVTTVRQRIKELQEEISKQQTVISQASQALNLCASTIEFSGSTEQAEGERLLLLATHRRQACLHEVQRLQVEGAGPAARAGRAALRVTGIVVPLRRDYVRQLNADGAVGHQAVCLVKCRDRVLATAMRPTSPTSTAIHFLDDIRMDGLTSDFKVTVEVYLLQASREVLPHEVKYHIHNKKTSSKLLTPKSKMSELKAAPVQSPGGPLAVRTPQFQLHGYCIFALPHANRKSFTLSKVPCGSMLEGSIQIEMSAKFLAEAPGPRAGFLTAFEDVRGLGAWHRRYCRLQLHSLAYWKYPDDLGKKAPIGDIDLSTVLSEKVVKAPRDLCARPNTLLLECSMPLGLAEPEHASLVCVRRADGTLVRRHLLAADTPKEADEWLKSLNDALEYTRCCSNDED